MAYEEQCYGVEAAQELISDPRYIVEEFIGAGAMACVYKVSERGTPNIYALKLLREKYRQRQQFIDIFEIEATHMRDLQYPNIVRFYKFVQEEKSAYILMDYVEGKPLTYYIQASRNGQGLMPLPKIVRIMAQIARAISYLHAEGYIHRDIKPGNVLLAGRDESALLTDLGIAGAMDVQDMYGGAGTPSYMPYEQQTQGTVNQTVDTYAFAIMLFEMFTSRKPFIPTKGLSFKEARAAIIELHRSEPIPSLVELRPELPEEIDEIFARALAKNPAERYGEITEFAGAIHAALLPLLPEELADFDKIRPQEIERSAQTDGVEVVTTHPSLVLFGGIMSIALISVLVVLGLWFNNTTRPPATATQALVAAPSEAPSDTPSVTPSPTETHTPAPQATATSFMAEALMEPVFQDIEAIGRGFGTSLDETIQELLALNAPFVPLRSEPNLERFSLELVLDENSLSNYSSYGLAFRMRDERNYLRLRVEVATSRWVLESVSEDQITLLQEDTLVSLPNRLAVTADDENYRLEIGEEIVPYSNEDWSGGSTALYFEMADTENLAVESVSIGMEETEGIPMPSLFDYLREDIQSLQATGDRTAVVQCPAFVDIYEKLDLYLAHESTLSFAQEAQSLSAFIYSRCLVEDRAVDFNNSYSDYLAWENGLDELLIEIDAASQN
jgi:serine/threonine protein kinase